VVVLLAVLVCAIGFYLWSAKIPSGGFQRNVTLFYKRECQEKKLSLQLEGAEKFFLTSSPCIDMRIRDFPDSPDSSCWRNDVHRFLMHQAVWL
jgi:hypothetical protein